jgi:hypothetical protein
MFSTQKKTQRVHAGPALQLLKDIFTAGIDVPAL